MEGWGGICGGICGGGDDELNEAKYDLSIMLLGSNMRYETDSMIIRPLP